MKNVFILIIVFCSTALFGQPLTYQIQLDLGDYIIPGNLANTADGGLVTCGTASIGATADAYIVKISSAGVVQWKKTYGTSLIETGKYIIQTSDGGYLMTGTIRLTNLNEDILLVRTDVNGDTLWTRSYGNANNDYGNSVIELPSGNFLVTGSCVIGSTKATVLRLDASGNLLSSNFNTSIYASPNMRANIIGPTSLVLTGTFATEIQTDTLGIYAGQTNIQLSGSGNTSDALLSTSGFHISTGTIDIGAPTGNSIAIAHSDATGTSNIWVQKYSASGASLSAVSIIESNDQGLIVAGHSYGFTGTANGLTLLKTDSIGTPVWAKIYNPVNGSEYTAGGGIATNDGGYAICGSVYYGSVADLIIIKTDSAGNSGCNEAIQLVTSSTAPYLVASQLGPFAGSLSNTGTWINSTTGTSGTSLILCSSTSGLNDLFSKSIFTVGPNPFTNKIALHCANEFNNSQLEWSLTDLTGKKVFNKKTVSENSIEFLPELPSGVYLLEVRSDDHVLVHEKLFHLNRQN
ncbi:MAG: T9SS type A sorting domain-containing protein [Bacteroidetes bacterium]|nr:T9SS type A sorting domain-containing protein [Bacteroidota bacterium]